MNLDKLIPNAEFSTAELHEIATALTKPAVVKYFKNEQAVALKAIANGLPKDGESDTGYLRRQAVVVGGLQIFEALLAIEKPTQAGSSD